MRLTFTIMLILGSKILSGQNKVPTNKHFWYSMETSAPSDSIWALWTDVRTWIDWDIGLSDASIEGEFSLGQKGTIISLEGRKSRFTVIEYIEGETYTIKTKLPLGSLYVKRYLRRHNANTIFTHEVCFKGITSSIFARAFGVKFRKLLPEVLSNIKENVEEDDTY